MGLDLSPIKIKKFADGEIYVQVQESIRGCDVFLVQPTCPPANDHLMELLIMIDACRRASARNITAVIPYFGYARADRKVSSMCFCRQHVTEVKSGLGHPMEEQTLRNSFYNPVDLGAASFPATMARLP